MLTDEQLALITAGIDGELTPAEARVLRRLLIASTEARDLYERLRADSDRLRTLPVVPVPVDLHMRVMARLAGCTPRPLPLQKHLAVTHAFSPRQWRWAPIAIAASVLVAVTASSFWFFKHNIEANHTTGDPGWVKALPPESASSPLSPTGKPWTSTDGHAVVVPGSTAPLPRPVDRGVVTLAPDPRPTAPDLHAYPAGTDLPPFDFVEVRVPFLKALSDFDRDDVRQEFIHELGLDPAYRVDLFTRDPARAVELFQATARAVGLTILTDTVAVERLSKRQVATAVVYAESLTAAELAELFARLASADAKISPRVFDQLHVTPAGVVEQKAITELLGVDPGLFKRPAGTDQVIDKSKPISAGTTDHVIKTLTGTVSSKPGDRTAILVAPGTNSRLSAEVKQYLQKRGTRQPNAIPVILVIRLGNG